MIKAHIRESDGLVLAIGPMDFAPEPGEVVLEFDDLSAAPEILRTHQWVDGKLRRREVGLSVEEYTDAMADEKTGRLARAKALVIEKLVLAELGLPTAEVQSRLDALKAQGL